MLTQTQIDDIALHLEHGEGPGSRVPVVRDTDTGGGTAPRVAAESRLPLLTEVLRALPPRPARLVVAADLHGGTVSYLSHLRALAPALELAAVVTTVDAAHSPARGAIGQDVTVLVPDRPTDICRAAVEYASWAARRTANPVIVQGPVGQMLDSHDAHLTGQGLRGAVESAEHDDGRDRRTTGPPPAFPVYSTARSALGAVVCGPVGAALVHRLEAVLRSRLARSVTNSRVALIGYRSRGSSAGAALHTLGARVAVCEPDPIRACAAEFAGHRTLGYEEALRWAEVVVDLSGDLLRDGAALELIRDEGVVMVPGPAWSTTPPGLIPGLVVVDSHEGLTACRTGSGALYLLSGHSAPHDAGGELVGPLNDLMCAELYLCIRELAARPHQRGFHHLGVQPCSDLAHRWYQIYGAAQ